MDRGSVALLLLSFNFGVVSSVGGGLEEAGQNLMLGSIPCGTSALGSH